MRCDCMVQWTAAIVSLDYDNNVDKSFGGEVVARWLIVLIRKRKKILLHHGFNKKKYFYQCGYYKLEKDSSLFKHKLKNIRGGTGHTFQEFPWHPHILSHGPYHTR